MMEILVNKKTKSSEEKNSYAEKISDVLHKSKHVAKSNKTIEVINIYKRKVNNFKSYEDWGLVPNLPFEFTYSKN